MSHLTLETLARLVDDEPTGGEAAHLSVCDACLGELQELRADAAALAALPDLMPPPRAWASLEARLEQEGLVRGRVVAGAAGGAAAARARSRWFGVVAQMAAAVALVGLGTGIGAFALAPRLAPAPGAVAVVPSAADLEAGRAVPVIDAPAPAPTTADAPAVDAPAAADPRQDVQPPAPREIMPRGGVRLASNETTPRLPRSADEALVLMREAEMAYLDALTRYAELAGGVPGGDPMARLAALEGIVLTTRAALGQAPADPVINGYHMTALAQREATLRQIAANSTQSWF